MSDQEGTFGFVLRITREDLERMLFVNRTFYVGIRRNWTSGSKALFVKRSLSGDSFIGTGIIEQFIPLDDLTEREKQLCRTNNWYGKILFKLVTKFLPAVNGTTLAAGRDGGNNISSTANNIDTNNDDDTNTSPNNNPSVLQTGEQVPLSEIEKISAAALTRLTS